MGGTYTRITRPGQPSSTGQRQRTIVNRCPECTKAIRHDLCYRRLGIGKCYCVQCWGTKIRQDAERHMIAALSGPVAPALLLEDVIGLRALYNQLLDDRKKQARSAPRHGKCRREGCGKPFTYSARGAHQVWCSNACRMRVYRAAKAAERRAEAMIDASLDQARESSAAGWWAHHDAA
jgi:hypothetical protein